MSDPPTGGPPATSTPAHSTSITLEEPVRLIVWDLDDTFWAGTLSEGAVTLDPSRIELVRTLNRRGIVNAICSKNDVAAVRARLDQVGLWDEFVFARIDWSPKGARVAQIIEDAQLRPESVLFIDDLPLNREEARHAVPGLQTAGPEIIDHLLSMPQLTGKDDSELSRLQQYKVLEKRLADRVATSASNESFLQSCDIRIAISHDTEAKSERLYEMLMRTNQLNFTKRRPDVEEFAAMLADPGFECGYVRMKDRYGDYGICGFYSVSLEDGALTDFLFSCRVLNMGVEQWLYDHLGRPTLTVVDDVASDLEGEVDWITMDPGLVDGGGGDPEDDPDEASSVLSQPDRVLIVGGCDLNTAAQFLGGDLHTEFSHTGATGAFIFVGHTETMRQSVSGLSDDQRAVVDRIPFLDQGVFRSPAVVAPDYDVLVHSVLTDYTQGLYRHRSSGVVVPWSHFDRDVTDAARWDLLVRRYTRVGMDREFFEWFAREFEFLGGVSVERFQENIRWLAASVPERARIIFLNGAEVPLDNPSEPDRHLHHRIMNTALDEVVADLDNATVCDVRAMAVSPDDLASDIRHYRRHVYLQMAEGIRDAGASNLMVQDAPLPSRAYGGLRKFAGRRKVQLRQMSRRRRGPAAGQSSTRSG
jgi:FkbH-like protein